MCHFYDKNLASLKKAVILLNVSKTYGIQGEKEWLKKHPKKKDPTSAPKT